MKIKEFFRVIDNIWNDVIKLSEKHKLVNVFVDRMEEIN